ncbi:MAG: hypothetical protein R6U96_07100 [Promethearchaeia archaeon]
MENSAQKTPFLLGIGWGILLYEELRKSDWFGVTLIFGRKKYKGGEL